MSGEIMNYSAAELTEYLRETPSGSRITTPYFLERTEAVHNDEDIKEDLALVRASYLPGGG